MIERKQVIPGDVIARGNYRYGSFVEKRGKNTSPCEWGWPKSAWTA